VSTEKEPTKKAGTDAKRKSKTLGEVNAALLRIVALKGKLKEMPALFVEGIKAALLWSSGDTETVLSGVLDDGELYFEESPKIPGE
jgi:hypothetical protein